MDPSHSQHEQVSDTPKKKSISFLILRWFIAILLPLLFFFSIPLLVGVVVVMVANFSISNPISLASHCKIVSRSVDIRSSKICELGLLNYKAKHVFHPFERSKFRCRYDYYWASVFKVEYRDHFSGQTQVAFSEAPNEALPLDCRPNFGAAWLTQYKFKVNETYDCWYTAGISKVRLYQDNLFSCHADEQSTLEMIRQYSTLAMEMVQYWFSGRVRTKNWKWEAIAGVVTGFSTPLISITVIRFLLRLPSSLRRFFAAWVFCRAANAVLIRRMCFLFGILLLCGLVGYRIWEEASLMDIFRFPKSWHLLL